MDRYLYKAKRTDNGEWVVGNLIDSPDGRNAISETSGDWKLHEVDTSTICQCTGLTDKNGKLIWENDIVKHYNHPDFPDRYDTGVIQWDDIELRFRRTSAMCEESVCISSSCIYEVVDSAINNPELLEVGE